MKVLLRDDNANPNEHLRVQLRDDNANQNEYLRVQLITEMNSD